MKINKEKALSSEEFRCLDFGDVFYSYKMDMFFIKIRPIAIWLNEEVHDVNAADLQYGGWTDFHGEDIVLPLPKAELFLYGKD